MIYVALLRGINVGGKTRVKMQRLKNVFQSLGFEKVSTYINSGNVIFSDTRPDAMLVPLIEKAIEKEFSLNIKVVLRDFDNLKKLCQEVPDDWTNDQKQKTDVLFLWDEINDEDILNKIKIDPKIENVRYIEGALIWNIGRENVTRGGGVKLIKSELYKHLTARNINTVRKLYKLMEKASD